MTYSLLDAMKEEIDLLKETEEYYDKNKNSILKAVVRAQKESLERIVGRFENGKKYYIGLKSGEPRLMTRQTTRHLEREYPSVAKAKQNLNTVVSLTGGTKQ